jgi:two-component system cell cycle sensor histidine kinase/response regulator CckA
MLATTRPKVLIVEDDSGVAYLQQRAIERAGYEVLVASTAEEARDVIEAVAIDLIVLDYRLEQNRTGLDFYTDLKAAGYDLPVIMVTGFSQESTVIQALRDGVRDFVTKSPDYLDYLPEAVHRVLKQVETENSLIDSEARFKSFMDNSPAAAFIKDEEGRYLYVNQLFQQLFPCTDWWHKTDFDLLPTDIAEAVRNNDLAVLAKGQSSEFIEEVPLPSGDLRHWLSYKFPIRDVQGRRSIGVMNVDITERRKAEELLRASEAKFRSVSESARDAIVAIDAHGTIISWNAGACNAFGYSADEVLGQSVELLMPERYRDSHRQGLQRARAIGQLRLVGKPVELQGLRKDGSEFPFEVCLGCWESDGEVYFSGVIRDITERKETEEAIRQRDQQLRHSQKMEALGTLAGGVAHEFNNLLQAILGYTRFAMEGLDDTDQRRQDLVQVVTAADRAAALTRQLLEFGRRQTIERTTLDPNQIVRDLVKMLRPLIGSNIELVVELAKDCAYVVADGGQLQQVLLNLCLNARDAMPSGGKLTIKTATVTIRHRSSPHAGDEQLVSIHVNDNGCGMSAETRQRIFEPFFTTKEVGKGTGLGLAVAYSLVQQQGGDLQVDSQSGQGSTFTITLPPATEQAPKRQRSTVTAAKGGTELILVAEDEALLNRFIVKLLEKSGYRTLSAAHGEEAVRLFQENPDVALVLVDVMMPGMSGYEVCQTVQALRPGVPVLLCSGHFPDEGRPDSLGHGEVELIQKPVEPAVLMAKVRGALDARVTHEQENQSHRFPTLTSADTHSGMATWQV